MSRNRLAEYISSIGPVETEAAKKREEEILKEKNLVLSDKDTPEALPTFDPPPFKPRHEVSALFKKFTDDFTESNFAITTNQRGVDLHWVGVGTWKPPEEIMSKHYLEAWKLSRENIARSNDIAMDLLKKEAQTKQTQRYIQNVPLERYRHSVTMEKHKDAVQDLLLGYREQLIEAVEVLDKSGKTVPDEIFEAITHIEIVIGAGQHWIGRAGKKYGKTAPAAPPSTGAPRPSTSRTTGIPSTRPPSEEERLFLTLVSKLGGNETLAEQNISEEGKKFPGANREELLKLILMRFP